MHLFFWKRTLNFSHDIFSEYSSLPLLQILYFYLLFQNINQKTNSPAHTFPHPSSPVIVAIKNDWKGRTKTLVKPKMRQNQGFLSFFTKKPTFRGL